VPVNRRMAACELAKVISETLLRQPSTQTAPATMLAPPAVDTGPGIRKCQSGLYLFKCMKSAVRMVLIAGESCQNTASRQGVHDKKTTSMEGGFNLIKNAAQMAASKRVAQQALR